MSGRGQYANTCQSCRVTLKRRGIKKLAVEHMGGQCQLCGYRRCLSALQFHHRDPREKDFTIADNSTDWPRVQREIEKCVLLCAVCHFEVHAGILDINTLLPSDEILRTRYNRPIATSETRLASL
jgi:hypothetical protein